MKALARDEEMGILTQNQRRRKPIQPVSRTIGQEQNHVCV